MDYEDRAYLDKLFENLSNQLSKYEKRLRTVEELIAVHQSLCKEHVTFREDISELQEDIAHTKGSVSGKFVAVGIIMSLLNLLLVAVLVVFTLLKGGIV